MIVLDTSQPKTVSTKPTVCAVFGGSFNPVHRGHEFIMRCVSQLSDIDKLLVVPAGCSPWKNKNYYLPSKIRLAMLQAVVACLPKVQIWEGEIKMNNISYSISTLRELQKINAGVTWHWVLGEDSLRGFPRWHEAVKLAHSASLIAIPRLSSTLSDSKMRLQQSLNHLQKWYTSIGIPFEQIRVLEEYPPRVSSHDILQNEKWEYLATGGRKIMLRYQKEQKLAASKDYKASHTIKAKNKPDS